jgi:hypothetical protein
MLYNMAIETVEQTAGRLTDESGNLSSFCYSVYFAAWMVREKEQYNGATLPTSTMRFNAKWGCQTITALEVESSHFILYIEHTPRPNSSGSFRMCRSSRRMIL